MSDAAAHGFLGELYRGRLAWRLLTPFPRQDAGDAARGDVVRARLVDLLRGGVDPTAVDADAHVPEAVVAQLRAEGFFKLRSARSVGGHELSHMNVFRLIETAASWSVPVALMIAIENAVGLSPFLPALPPRLAEAMAGHVAAGSVTGSADTEPEGSANKRRTTTATPAPDGRGYVLSGEKVHVGNAPLADVLSVSAAVTEDGREEVRVFFVDTASPGFRMKAWHEFMGVKGFPNGNITLDDVYVARERMLVEEGDRFEAMPDLDRLTPELNRLLMIGRMHLIAAPSLAIAKLCAKWSRDFCVRRRIDGQPLGEYDWIKRVVATTLADVFAIESLVRWCLLAEQSGRDGVPPLDATLEQGAAKNIASEAAWRVVDRTMSLLAGEGYETARSKARRGAPAIPLERNFRDARNFRISGGVDFQLDNWTGSLGILPLYYADGGLPRTGPPDAPPEGLSTRNERHRAAVDAGVAELGQACRELAARHPDRAELCERERFPIAVSRIANELLAMALTLARAATDGGDMSGALADVYCTGARRRLAAHWADLREDDLPDHDGLAAAWLAGDDLDGLLVDVIAEVPDA